MAELPTLKEMQARGSYRAYQMGDMSFHLTFRCRSTLNIQCSFHVTVPQELQRCTPKITLEDDETRPADTCMVCMYIHAQLAFFHISLYMSKTFTRIDIDCPC